MAAVEYVASADGTRIAYRVSGRGDPVLLVHGSATSGADWLFVLPLLRDRFAVVTQMSVSTMCSSAVRRSRLALAQASARRQSISIRGQPEKSGASANGSSEFLRKA